jgi:hypothetical protein|tara:strand:- start:1597 stop:1950 length:354 start_codon:yes stop_codon:yes gene_type:complete
MGINSTEVSYQFGQLGSAYTTASSDAIVPPTNKVFVAITMLADTVFDSSNGLVSTEPTKYINTETAANDLAGGSETTDQGSGGKVVDSVSFPLGVTIYGRWNEIDVLSGSVVAYIGD